ncbi:hypothetical protein FKM82_025188 [Ascaphus truei]
MNQNRQMKRRKQKVSSRARPGYPSALRTDPHDRVVMLCEDIPSDSGRSCPGQQELTHLSVVESEGTYSGSIYSIRSEMQLREL